MLCLQSKRRHAGGFGLQLRSWLAEAAKTQMSELLCLAICNQSLTHWAERTTPLQDLPGFVPQINLLDVVWLAWFHIDLSSHRSLTLRSHNLNAHWVGTEIPDFESPQGEQRERERAKRKDEESERTKVSSSIPLSLYAHHDLITGSDLCLCEASFEQTWWTRLKKLSSLCTKMQCMNWCLTAEMTYTQLLSAFLCYSIWWQSRMKAAQIKRKTTHDG